MPMIGDLLRAGDAISDLAKASRGEFRDILTIEVSLRKCQG